MPITKKVAVMTGSRADWALLRPVACELMKRCEVKVIVAGQHNVQGTWREIESAGFRISTVAHEAEQTYAMDCANIMQGMVWKLQDHEPDIVLVLGDRIEAFAAASAASLSGIHVAHIHGGCIARGVADDSMRFAITKMSHLHFPATLKAANRIEDIGERGDCIFLAGSPALDNMGEIPPYEDVHPSGDIIVLMHPVGDSTIEEYSRMERVVHAIDVCAGESRRVYPMPNTDPGHVGILHAIPVIPQNMSRREFVGRLKSCRLLIGNSSCAAIEGSWLGVPTVNVGDRQEGREFAKNAVHCDDDFESLCEGIKKATAMGRAKPSTLYGSGDASQYIATTLDSIDLASIQQRKKYAERKRS